MVNDLQQKRGLVKAKLDAIEAKYGPGYGLHKSRKPDEQADKKAFNEQIDLLWAIDYVLLKCYNIEY